MANELFKFKRFSVEQAGCAMKINTDGVLLAALSKHPNPKTILDIGTGTGVIALMLAQKYPDAKIDALEIDVQSANTAIQNFKDSPFSDRINGFALSFQEYFNLQDFKYDLIISNPPFFLDSLPNPNHQKNTARHTTTSFFKELITCAAKHLTTQGLLVIIVPVVISNIVTEIACALSLETQQITVVKSFPHSVGHRNILTMGFGKQFIEEKDFTIYDSHKVYSSQYREALKDYFTIFPND